jgi:hypothetical protein
MDNTMNLTISFLIIIEDLDIIKDNLKILIIEIIIYQVNITMVDNLEIEIETLRFFIATLTGQMN